MDVLQARLEKSQREKRNAMLREQRAKSKCQDLLAELKEKNLLSEELEDKLAIYNSERT